jgi:transcriptional regulator with XRE-family HTH domain
LHVLISIGVTLDAYLKANGLSQSDFAELVKVPESQVSLWRRGERRPDTDNRLRIAAATGGAIRITDWPKPRRRAVRRTSVA